jgi:hypothetical protein
MTESAASGLCQFITPPNCPTWIMPHPEVGVQNDAIHAVVATAQQILIESAQPVRHEGQVTGTLPPPSNCPAGATFSQPRLRKGVDPWRPRKVLVPGVVSHATNVVSTLRSSPTASSTSPGWSGARTSWPAPIVASAAGHHDRPPGDLDDAVGPQPRPRTGRNQVRRELGARGISRASCRITHTA